MVQMTNCPKNPFDLDLGDGREHQDAIRSAGTSRLCGLNALPISQLGGQYRVFSGTRLAPARREAARADRERGVNLCSDVDGLFVTVKGNISHRDLYWTEGTRQFGKRRPNMTADPIAALERAGAIVIGSTTMTELATYAPDNPAEPIAINPWAPKRTPGGSSSGAGVAAALGLGHLHIGTDSGGSIRNPALHCGVFGFKPSLARWSMGGVASYSPSLDTLGVIARSVEDIICADKILSKDGGEPPLGTEPRFVIPRRLVDTRCDDMTKALFERAVRRLGEGRATVTEADIGDWELAERAAGRLSRAEFSRATAGCAIRTLVSPRLVAILGDGDRISDAEIGEVKDICDSFASRLRRQLADNDVVLTPTWPFRAPAVHQSHVVVRGSRITVDPHRNVFVRAANAARAPAITLPAGRFPGNVPFGIQLVAAAGRDANLLDAARKAARVLSSSRDC